MLGKSDLITTEGLRIDGRRKDEIRLSKFTVGFAHHATGSSEVEIGGTRLQVAVFGPLEKSSSVPDRTVLNVHYRVATLASSDFKALSSKNRQNEEMKVILKRTFEPVIIKKTFERSMIDVHVFVLQMDGGVLPAAINAISLALADASIPITDYVCSCSAGILHDKILTDLSYLEETSKIPALTIAITPTKQKIITLDVNSSITPLELEKLVNVAIIGCSKIHLKINNTIRDSISRLLQPIKSNKPSIQYS